jgi:pSer/pThr/pTyr-binding forkhead associated (FHA) protein
LRLTSPDGKVSPFSLRRQLGTRVSLGRSVSGDPPPDIVVDSGPSSPVSRLHARLEFRTGAWWIIRKGKNPPLIRYRGESDIERIEKRAQLRNGDVIIIAVRPLAENRPRHWEIEFLDPQETNTA